MHKIEEGLRFENGKYYNEYKEIHNYLAEYSKSIQEEDVKVLGVVVTGTVEDLTTVKTLKNDSFISNWCISKKAWKVIDYLYHFAPNYRAQTGYYIKPN